ncbi:DUF4199 domain-containing protein [Mucilaginibacter sp. HC2]|uniref:DUF4199 domain-containing protein n=1 Tax=Mucilaginibacter inviolabilis TaxID=2714892 RepID=UPI00140DE851|nr:DUF4199 domain-containing protein [Mucilaginibacter inviolabilis]NHA07330.1 DUF4199 domain-containing protein [Mucilaginibacter inviolabilis]
MEIQKTSPMPVIIKWGAIYVIASIVLTYIIQFMNVDPDSPIKWLSTLLFIGFMFLTQKEYRDVNGGYLTFGEGFKAGFLFAILSGIVLAVFTYLYFSVLSPEMLEKIVASTEAKMASKGLSQEQVDQAMSFTKKLLSPAGVTISALISAAIMGAIIALIGAAIFKKDRPPVLISDNDGDSFEPTV